MSHPVCGRGVGYIQLLVRSYYNYHHPQLVLLAWISPTLFLSLTPFNHIIRAGLLDYILCPYTALAGPYEGFHRKMSHEFILASPSVYHKLCSFYLDGFRERRELVGRLGFMAYQMLVGWVLWHINLCRLFNVKSTFM